MKPSKYLSNKVVLLLALVCKRLTELTSPLLLNNSLFFKPINLDLKSVNLKEKPSTWVLFFSNGKIPKLPSAPENPTNHL